MLCSQPKQVVINLLDEGLTATKSWKAATDSFSFILALLTCGRRIQRHVFLYTFIIIIIIVFVSSLSTLDSYSAVYALLSLITHIP